MADPNNTLKRGGLKFKENHVYVGFWNKKGRVHNQGHMLFPNGARYDGNYDNGLFSGLGVLHFPDGAKYEGEFLQGWFHGYGVFWRADGMRYEGEFRGGKMWGLGCVTFSDGTNGFPRNEGYFKDCNLVRVVKCPEVIQKAQKISFIARVNAEEF